MELEEVINRLDCSKVDKEVELLSRDIQGLDMYSAQEMIQDIKTAQNAPYADRSDTKKPFYFFFLAYAYRIAENWEDARIYAQRAEAIFGKKGDKWNEAISLWFTGILFGEQGETDSAVLNQTEALDIISKLEAENRRSGTFINKYSTLLQLIKRSLREIETGVHNPKMPYHVYADLIGYLDLNVPEDLDPDLVDRWDDIKFLKPSERLLASKDMVSYLRSVINEGRQTRVFYLLFLVHHYNLTYYSGGMQYLQLAAEAANELIDYIKDLNEYNQSLSFYYLGLLYYNFSDTKNGLSCLEKADRLLTGIIRKEKDPQQREFLQSQQADIKAWISQINQEPQEDEGRQKPSRLSLKEPLVTQKPASRELPSKNQEGGTGSGTPGRSGVRTTKPPEQKPPAPPVTPPVTISPTDDPSVLRITIPVDKQALLNYGTTSDPTDSNFFERLKRYNEKLMDQFRGTRQATANANPAAAKPQPHRPVIPQLKIYAEIPTGVGNETHLAPIGNADAVDESLEIAFNSKKYKITFISDESIPFTQGKRYGWLEANRKNMNNATPTSINEKDYALFYENHDPDRCNEKIVIAQLAEKIETVSIVMGRFIKMSGKNRYRADGFGPEIVKYILQSEAREKDPRTGMDYKDIEIAEANQLRGEVVAIAKPIE